MTRRSDPFKEMEKNVLGRENIKCEGSVTGISLASSRIRKVSVAGYRVKRGKVGDEVRAIVRPRRALQIRLRIWVLI